MNSLINSVEAWIGETLPIIVCLDSSAAMAGHVMALNEALQIFVGAVRQNPIALDAVAWEFVSFQTDSAGNPWIIDHLGQFQPASEPFELAAIKAEGFAALWEAVDFALRKLEAYKYDLKAIGRPCLQPWLVVMTSSVPTTALSESVIRRIEDLVSREKLAVIAVGLGPDADKASLQKLSPVYDRVVEWRDIPKLVERVLDDLLFPRS
jgi:uncharacterized protein YegL